MSPLAAPALLLARPFSGYAALARAHAAGDDDAPTALGGALRLLVVLGAVVSLTATGRLAPIEATIAAGSFAYVPIVQALALAFALRVIAPKVPFARALALHFAGSGPWLLALLGVAAVALLAPRPAPALFTAIPILAVIAWAWGNVLTYALFRGALGLSRARSAAGVALHLVGINLIVPAYFLAFGQLAPLFLR